MINPGAAISRSGAKRSCVPQPLSARPVRVAILLAAAVISSPGARADNERNWVPGAMLSLLHAPHDLAAEATKQDTPPTIPALSTHRDPEGIVSTSNANGPTVTSDNPFFLELGSN